LFTCTEALVPGLVAEPSFPDAIMEAIDDAEAIIGLDPEN